MAWDEARDISLLVMIGDRETLIEVLVNPDT